MFNVPEHTAKELLLLIAGGDEQAFAQLFRDYRNNIYSVAYTYTEHTELSEEIVQDVFVSVWKKRGKLAEVQDADAWLYTIVRNYSLNALKQMARIGRDKQELLSHLPIQINDVEDKSALADLQVLLQQAMEQLSPQQRKVFELSRMQGYTREEIAAALGLTTTTVSSHLTLALRTVRAFLANRMELPVLLVLLNYYR